MHEHDPLVEPGPTAEGAARPAAERLRELSRIPGLAPWGDRPAPPPSAASESEAQRWRRAEAAFGRLLGAWAVDIEMSEEPIRRWYGAGGPLARPSPELTLVLIEYLLFDYRAKPDEPTVAERRLTTTTRWRPPELEALARSAVAAPLELLRVEHVERGASVSMRPVFPAGPPVVVHERSACLALEVGQLLGGRTYVGGTVGFLRSVGVVVPSHGERVLFDALERSLRRFVKRGGADDPAALLRAQPEVLVHALRAAYPSS